MVVTHSDSFLFLVMVQVGSVESFRYLHVTKFCSVLFSLWGACSFFWVGSGSRAKACISGFYGTNLYSDTQ